MSGMNCATTDIEALVVELRIAVANGPHSGGGYTYVEVYPEDADAAADALESLGAERDRLRRAIEDALAWLTDERLNDHQHIEGARVNLTAALEGAEHAN